MTGYAKLEYGICLEDIMLERSPLSSNWSENVKGHAQALRFPFFECGCFSYAFGSEAGSCFTLATTDGSPLICGPVVLGPPKCG